MDSNYTNSLPLNQPICMDSNGIYSYPLCQAYLQPPSQVILPSDTPLDNNNVYMGVNTQLNPAHYGYSTMNDGNRVNYDLTDYNSPATHYYLPQTSGQTPPASTRPNNAGMTTNATRGYVVIIVRADINLERLLSIIQSCEREEM